jgi:hypothetical protein
MRKKSSNLSWCNWRDLPESNLSFHGPVNLRPDPRERLNETPATLRNLIWT